MYIFVLSHPVLVNVGFWAMERRKHERIHARIEIPYWKYVKFKRQGKVHIGFVKNMSKGGFYIESEVVYEPGVELGFEFFLPNSPKAIAGFALVKWTRREAKAGEMSGMGVEFVRFEAGSEALLQDFMLQEMKRHSP